MEEIIIGFVQTPFVDCCNNFPKETLHSSSPPSELFMMPLTEKNLFKIQTYVMTSCVPHPYMIDDKPAIQKVITLCFPTSAEQLLCKHVSFSIPLSVPYL